MSDFLLQSLTIHRHKDYCVQAREAFSIMMLRYVHDGSSRCPAVDPLPPTSGAQVALAVIGEAILGLPEWRPLVI